MAGAGEARVMPVPSPIARTVRCAVNQEFAEPATLVHPGDEVAFFPPVTGG